MRLRDIERQTSFIPNRSKSPSIISIVSDDEKIITNLVNNPTDEEIKQIRDLYSPEDRQVVDTCAICTEEIYGGEYICQVCNNLHLVHNSCQLLYLQSKCLNQQPSAVFHVDNIMNTLYKMARENTSAK